MQRCQSCGKEVKYIAIKSNESVCCDAEEIEIYTLVGRKVKGWKKHICGEKDGTESKVHEIGIGTGSKIV